MSQTESRREEVHADSGSCRGRWLCIAYCDVCIIFVAVGVVLLWAYSVLRWIGDPTWLGASSPGLGWVPQSLAVVACLADVAGVIAFLRCILRGNFWTRVLTLLPGVLLCAVLCWIVVQSFRVYIVP